MGKKNAGSSNRVAQVAKAGKRSGSTVWPASASPERLAAKEQGEKQFISPSQLTVEREGTVIVFDQKLGKFVYRTKKIVLSTEHVFDATRDRVVYSPSYKEKSSK
jgi:hypothetical protein